MVDDDDLFPDYFDMFGGDENVIARGNGRTLAASDRTTVMFDSSKTVQKPDNSKMKNSMKKKESYYDVAKDAYGRLGASRNTNRLAIMACAAKTRTSGCRPNEIATVRYLRRALAIERC